MKHWLLIFLFLILITPLGFAVDSDLKVLKHSCFENGKLRLIVDSTGYIIDSNTIEVKAVFEGEEEDEEDVNAFYFPLKSSVRYITSEENVTLESNEAVFNWSGMYRLSISYDKDGEVIKFPYGVGCPGLTFSCKLAKLEIIKCDTKNDKFEAEVLIENLEILEGTEQIENVEFSMEAEKAYEDVNGETSTIGGLAKTFEITNVSNIYTISGEFKNNKVKSLSAKFDYTDCELEVEKECGEEEEIVSISSTNSSVTEITGEIGAELEKRRQEVAEIVKKNVEARERNLAALIWFIFISISVIILGIGIYILIRRKANKKPEFVKF